MLAFKDLRSWVPAAKVTEIVFYFVAFLSLREQFSFLTHHEFPHLGVRSEWTHRWIPAAFNFKKFAFYLGHVQIVLFPFLVLLVNNFWSRLCMFVILLINVTTRVNYFDAHNYHLYFYVSFLFLFFLRCRSGAALRLRLAQIQLLLVYFISGVWKVGSFFENFYRENYPNFIDHLSYVVAQEYINSSTIQPLGRYVVENPWSGALGQLLILLMEFGALPVIFFPRFYPVWGMLIVGFHSFAWLAMGLFFRDTQAIAFCLLVLPFIFRKSQEYFKL